MTLKEYLPLGNWEPFVHRRLNEIIDRNSYNNYSYAVFDFDNTSIIMDIEDNTMLYMLDNLLYKLTPEELHRILLVDESIESELWISGNSQSSTINFVTDIISDYKFLYDNYISLEDKDEIKLTEIKETQQYNDFKTRLIYYYQRANDFDIIQQKPGKVWPIYWFSGYTRDEYKKLLKDCYNNKTKNTLKKINLKTINPGLSGHLAISYKDGIVISKDLLNLYKAFQSNGIKTYIVSASPIDNVIVAGEFWGHNVASDQVIAIKYETDSNDIIIPRLKENTEVVHGPGKVDHIRQYIMPKHANHEPIAIFGDSMGDFNMLTEFSNCDLNVLFNLVRNDQTQEIVDLAIEQYGNPKAKYVLQGRDENKGALHSSMKTILFGDDKATLKPSTM